jgi:RNA polymerase sigma-70 factor (ECF subfamily)
MSTTLCKPVAVQENPVDYAALLEEARAGSRAALTIFLLDACDAARRRIERKVRESAKAARHFDADEILQTACTRAMDSLAGFQPTPGRCPRESFRYWFGKIADNRFIDEVRKRELPMQARARVAEGDSQADAGTVSAIIVSTSRTPSRAMGARELHRAAQEALEHISPEYRAVLDMRIAHEMPYEVIAEKLGKTPDNVKQIHHRALKAVRDQMDLSRFTSRA